MEGFWVFYEWLDNFEGKFEDQYFGFEGDVGFEGWYFEEDVVLDMMLWRDGDWG